MFVHFVQRPWQCTTAQKIGCYLLHSSIFLVCWINVIMTMYPDAYTQTQQDYRKTILVWTCLNWVFQIVFLLLVRMSQICPENETWRNATMLLGFLWINANLAAYVIFPIVFIDVIFLGTKSVMIWSICLFGYESSLVVCLCLVIYLYVPGGRCS